MHKPRPFLTLFCFLLFAAAFTATHITPEELSSVQAMLLSSCKC